MVIKLWPRMGTQMNKVGGICEETADQSTNSQASTQKGPGRNSIQKLWWWCHREDWAMPCAQKAKNNLQKKFHMTLQPPPIPVSFS